MADNVEDGSEKPGFFKWVMGVLGLGAVTGAIAAPFVIPKYGIWIAVIVLVLAAALFGGWYFYHQWNRRKKGAALETGIAGLGSVGSTGISEEARRSIDDIRRKFEQGLEKYKQTKADIYTLPWYLFVGQSGSGKTEAIRRSGVKFPAGHNNKTQGAGGTIGMHWWFASKAIILDTAGNLMLPEEDKKKVEDNRNPAWEQFLKFLKRARARCPINGVVLCIPVDKLLTDNKEKIQEQADKIAQEFDRIQRILDVRFPVYILITKCDYLTGFREFTETIKEPAMQEQIVGWSNPDDLDKPFSPDDLREHLKGVVQRLRRRIVTMVGGTDVTGDFAGRRLDYFDATYALPQSILRLESRLRKYLETIFPDDADPSGLYVAKRPFIRGVYFTSALQEGKELDEFLSEMLGQHLELDTEKKRGKETAYFLRDLFEAKIFPEQGLVTPALNVSREMRRRRAILLGSVGASVALLLIMAVFAYGSLKKSVLSESRAWRLAAKGFEAGAVDRQLVTRSPDGQSHVYNGTNVVAGGNGQTLEQLHSFLRERAEKPETQISWIFKPAAAIRGQSELDRKAAQQIVFEHDIVEPLVTATRQKMERTDSKLIDPVLHSDALKALMRWEADFLTSRPEVGYYAEKYLTAWQSYLVGQRIPAATNLVDVWTWTYSTLSGRTNWAATTARLSAGTNSLAANRSIDHGLDVFLEHVKRSQEVLLKRLDSLEQLRDSAKEFRIWETRLVEWVEQGNPADDARLEALRSARVDLDQKLDRTEKSLSPALGTAQTRQQLTSLDSVFGAVVKEAEASSKESVNQAFAEFGGDSKVISSGLFRQAKDKLDRFGEEAPSYFRGRYEGSKTEIKALDECILLQDVPSPDGRPLRKYAFRHDVYEEAVALRTNSYSGSFDTELFGKKWGPLLGLDDKVMVSMPRRAAAYQGCIAEKFNKAWRSLGDDARRRVSDRMVADYNKIARDRLEPVANLNLTEATDQKLNEVWGILLRILIDDLDPSAIKAARLSSEQERKIEELRSYIRKVRDELAVRYGEFEVAGLREISGKSGMITIARLKEYLSEVGKSKERIAIVRRNYPVPEIDEKMAQFKTNLFERYLGGKKSEVGEMLGFPLVRDRVATPITLDGLKAFRQKRAAILEETSDPVFLDFPKTSMKGFVDASARFESVAQALVNEDGIPRTVSIAALVDAQTKEETLFASVWRLISLVADGQAKKPQGLDFRDPTRLGTFGLEKSLVVELRRFENTPAERITLGPWGAVKLIHTSANATRSPDGRTWTVKIPYDWTNDGQLVRGVLRLEFVFESSLPEIGRWPTSIP
jgi:hypothetical protein